MKHWLICGVCCWLLAGCNLAAEPETPVSTPNTIVILVTPTAAEVVATPTLAPTTTPIATTTPTDAPTQAPTLTPTITLTPSVTPTASITPMPTTAFRFDNWTTVELPAALLGGAKSPYVVFTNSNDQVSITNLATAQPENTIENVYVVSPETPFNRIKLLELNTESSGLIFPAAAGTGIAYFVKDGIRTGLYILNLKTDLAYGLSGRIAAVDTLVQRGIYSPPQWSPDGDWLAVTLATGYDLDIFIYDRAGNQRQNLTENGSYDFFPSWSPDGRYLAFVSDRADCPSWIPDEPNACDALSRTPSVGGQVYLLEVATKTVRKISDQYVTEAPRWINNTLLVFAAGDRTDLLNPSRTLWMANVLGESVRQITIPNDTSGLYLSDVWSPDGSRVFFQHVTSNSADVVLLNTQNNTVLRQESTNLVFPRFGMTAAWSPVGNRIAIGGTSECPYGVRVSDEDFDLIAVGTPPPTMCNPQFSPDGRYIAFSGISLQDRRNPDGRVDVYTSSESGFSQQNLSVDLRGKQSLIGWLGGR